MVNKFTLVYQILGQNDEQLEGSIKILNRDMYHELAEPAAWGKKIYVELQYASIIEAVRQGHLEQAQREEAWRSRLTWGEAEFDIMKKFNDEKFASLSM